MKEKKRDHCYSSRIFDEENLEENYRRKKVRQEKTKSPHWNILLYSAFSIETMQCSSF